MILSCNHIMKSFFDVTILKDASFHLEDHEKAAIVGINGAGKSTLMKIIAGILEADSGEVAISKGKTMGYLSQHPDLNSDGTIYDELISAKKDILSLEQRMHEMEEEMHSLSGEELSRLIKQHSDLHDQFEKANGYAIQSEITGVLKGLGFLESDFSLPVHTLSGGQRTRVALGKMLLTSPDILLLDEPTNHLDLTSVAWLETYLINYPGSVLIISHDRYFLDRVVTKVINIEMKETTVFQGNYTVFAEKRQAIWEAKQKEYEKQQQEIHHQEDVIAKLKSFNREKSIKRAESREKMLNKIERLEKPVEENDAMKLKLTPNVLSGNDVLTIEHLSKSFDDKELFTDVNLEIKRGEHVAIIGDNGTGKTTLLKIINELIPASSGDIITGSKVHIGYYDQEHQVLHMEKNIFEEISDDYPTMTNTQIRTTLAAFLFTGDDVYKLISELSGGERGRVSLAKLMLSDANFLILDEPTNHLDMESKEILENAIRSYEGTVLYVSHDRYFINRTANRILELYQKSFINYIGNYDYFLEKEDSFHEIYGISSTSTEVKNSTTQTNIDWKKQKEEQAQKRKRENDLKKAEEQIDLLETLIASIDAEMCLPENSANSAKLSELTQKRQEAEKNLSIYYEKWESLAE